MQQVCPYQSLGRHKTGMVPSKYVCEIEVCRWLGHLTTTTGFILQGGGIYSQFVLPIYNCSNKKA